MLFKVQPIEAIGIIPSHDARVYYIYINVKVRNAFLKAVISKRL